MIIPIGELGKIGLITDRPFDELPLSAWTDGRNIRFRDGAVEKFSGHVQVFGTPTWKPDWLLHYSEGGLPLWIYTAGTKVGATDGTSHADITRAVGGNYSVPSVVGWTGGIIEKIPIINNGLDIPQMWVPAALATKLQDLSNWPTDLRANTLRVMKRYLVALDCSKVGVRFPNMIKWSHQAPTGGVPASWDETDDALDAGEYTLPGDGGFVVDGVMLRDQMILYKEYQTWRMTYVGGVDIFQFQRAFDNVGALSRRCAVEFFAGKHLVFTGSDIVLHDGHQAESVLTEKARKVLSTLNAGNLNACFLVSNYESSEVWACYAEHGHTYANRAVVWNWLTNTIGDRELPDAAFIENGIVNQAAVSDAWDSAVGTWDTDTQAWGDRAGDPTKRRLLMCVPGVTTATSKFFTPGISNQFDNQSMLAYVERQGLGFPLKREQPPNYDRMKQVLGLYPRVSGTPGAELRISLGTQISIGGPVTWGSPKAFTLGETPYLDFSDQEAARVHAVRFESDTDLAWRLHGYDVDVIDRGAF